jgi:DNA-binding beta-propeller fold protein YncE
MRERSPVALAVAALLLGTVAGAGAEPVLDGTWCLTDSGSPGANSLRGVAVHGSSLLYLADPENSCILRLNDGAGCVTTWGEPGSAPGQYREPCALAVNNVGRLFVADMDNHRVQVLDTDGTVLRIFGEPGDGAGQLCCVRGIAVDQNGNVYVADAFNYRVQKFQATGTYLTSWGSAGDGPGRFGRALPPGQPGPGERREHLKRADADSHRFVAAGGPGALAVGPAGDVYVLDPVNHRVQRFTADGAFVAAWGDAGSGPGQFCRIQGIAVDPSGLVYVADTGNGRVQVFSGHGSYVTEWNRFRRGRVGGRPGEDVERPPFIEAAQAFQFLAAPVSLGVDDSGRLLVIDQGAGTLYRFRWRYGSRKVDIGLVPDALGSGSPAGSVVEVVIPGAIDLPVETLDWGSIRLGGLLPAAIRAEDTATVLDGAGPRVFHRPDGLSDLVLTFSAEDVAEALDQAAGVPLDLTGLRQEGSPIWASAEDFALRDDRVGGGPREHVQRLAYTVPEACRVRIDLFDVSGRLVRHVLDEVQSSGPHALVIRSHGLANGVYLARVRVGDRVTGKKLRILQ